MTISLNASRPLMFRPFRWVLFAGLRPSRSGRAPAERTPRILDCDVLAGALVRRRPPTNNNNDDWPERSRRKRSCSDNQHSCHGPHFDSCWGSATEVIWWHTCENTYENNYVFLKNITTGERTRGAAARPRPRLNLGIPEIQPPTQISGTIPGQSRDSPGTVPGQSSIKQHQGCQ